MSIPSQSEAVALAKDDAREAIGIARERDRPYPLATIADGAEHHGQTTGFHKRWWRSHDEGWPASLRESYDEAFTREVHDARVAVVELQFDAASGSWTNIAVVDLAQWEPTFPFDPASTGWIRQDPRSRVGWRRRSALRKLFRREKDKPADQGSNSLFGG